MDFEKTAEKNLTETQEYLSKERLRVVREIEARTGATGHLELVDGRLVGEIKGHNISVGFPSEGKEKVFTGTLDGFTLTSDEAKKVWSQFSDVAYNASDMMEKQLLEAERDSEKKKALEDVLSSELSDDETSG
jgi:hypothetical protein